MAWDFVLGKDSGRDFTCGGLGDGPKWTPATVVKLVEQTDGEIKKTAKDIAGAGPTYLRPGFGLFFKKWLTYKSGLGRPELSRVKTVKEVKLFRQENGKFARALAPTSSAGEVVAVGKKSNWPLAIGLGAAAGVFGWLAFRKN